MDYQYVDTDEKMKAMLESLAAANIVGIYTEDDIMHH